MNNKGSCGSLLCLMRPEVRKMIMFLLLLMAIYVKEINSIVNLSDLSGLSVFQSLFNTQ